MKILIYWDPDTNISTRWQSLLVLEGDPTPAVGDVVHGGTVYEVDGMLAQYQLVGGVAVGYTPPVPVATARKHAYPPIGDQLDAMLKFLDTQTIPEGSDLEGIIAEWKQVKLDYPKE